MSRKVGTKALLVLFALFMSLVMGTGAGAQTGLDVIVQPGVTPTAEPDNPDDFVQPTENPDPTIPDDKAPPPTQEPANPDDKAPPPTQEPEPTNPDDKAPPPVNDDPETPDDANQPEFEPTDDPSTDGQGGATEQYVASFPNTGSGSTASPGNAVQAVLLLATVICGAVAASIALRQRVSA